MNYASSGKRVGCQAFGILPRIAAVDRLMRADVQEHVHEGHPEVSFAVIAGRPMFFPKKRPEGQQERLALLAAHGLALDPEEVRGQLGRQLVAG